MFKIIANGLIHPMKSVHLPLFPKSKTYSLLEFAALCSFMAQFVHTHSQLYSRSSLLQFLYDSKAMFVDHLNTNFFT